MLSFARRALTISLVGLLSLTACEEKKSNKLTLGQKPAQCELSLDSLAGTEWVIEKINPDKSTEPDIQTRMKIDADGGNLAVKYNVSSLSDMYDYSCTMNSAGDEYSCKEEPKLADFCKALATGGSECSAATLKEFSPESSDEDINAAVAAATETINKYKDTPQWDAFVLQNNNLGNKLQGILYLKVDKRSCKLRVTDNYMTIYNGKRMEDSNPVGTNLFIKNEAGELMWEHCSNSENLIAWESAELPKKIEEAYTTLQWEANKEVHFFHAHPNAMIPEEGCTYSFDLWQDWKPVQKGIEATISEGRKPNIQWHYAQTFTTPGRYITEMIRYKTCNGGAKEKIEVSCNLVQVM